MTETAVPYGTGVKIDKVSVTYGRKFNLGDYNSANIAVTIWADVDDGVDLDDTMNRLWQMAKDNVKAQALPLVGNHEAQVEQIFMGLPVELRGRNDAD